MTVISSIEWKGLVMFNFDPEEIRDSLEEAVQKAGRLVSDSEDKIQEISDAKSSMEDAQSSLEEASEVLGNLPDMIQRYENAIGDLETHEIYL